MDNLRILLIGKICGEEFHWIIPPPPQTDTNNLVSSYMNRHGFLDMQSNYHLDGWYAAREGQPLAAMPTEYHESGWFAANMAQREQASEQQDDRDDEDFWRKGC